ncbi:2-oxoacid:acceptor oxidoreductase subunit alpha [Fonticella tunisiensis]|uniref:2-oxoglutarate ferredoxin oxidoreductase subunit alpha n=1 Tax=Fonticella tunisiensis TaxID=1096341 RepID=A0A4R7KSJ3_9CLOT|nr:2-oxoacid:acceptor oxidoreductase subunit alpha [Fonticella tunisiensis]TDT61886.1 2-oxoglutarate ferredoxin oxidoreductase subunit alpha [Fonticella tunisiensis]
MGEALLMQGNEACVRGAIRAGMRFFAGYPITPSTEIAELASLMLPKYNGKFIQMEDEISSMAAVIGASLCGLKAMTATSGPGFSLKQENIGYASMTEIPCVVVDVMRGGPSTGLPTCVSQGDVMQSRWGTHGDHPVIVIAPSTVKDIYYMTIKAFNYSERYRIPVILLLDEVNAHMRESVVIENDVEIWDRKRPLTRENHKPYAADEDGVPPMGEFGKGYRFHVTGLVHDETGHPTNSSEEAEKLIRRLHYKLEKSRDDIVIYEKFKTERCRTLIIAFGSVARVCKDVICQINDDSIGLFIPYTIWPFPDKELLSLIQKNRIERIYVPELNTGQMILEVQRIVFGRCEVLGINKYSGELITPTEIIKCLRRG